MEFNLPKASKRPFNLILGFFALVGFLASLTTIAEFFNRDRASSLEVEVQQHKFMVPEYSGKAMQSAEPARILSDELRSISCEGLSDDEVVKTSYADIPAKFGDQAKDAESCKQMQDIEFAARWAGAFSTSPASMYEYRITNTGSNVAKGIRVGSDRINSLQYSLVDDEYTDVRINEGESFYPLPDLNPRESYSVYVWTGSFSDLEYRGWENLPRVTFSGSDVHTEFFKPVPDGWYEVYNIFFKDTSWVFVIILIVGGSFLVTIVCAIIIAVAQAIFTGQPISSVFSNKSSDQLTPEAKASMSGEESQT